MAELIALQFLVAEQCRIDDRPDSETQSRRTGSYFCIACGTQAQALVAAFAF